MNSFSSFDRFAIIKSVHLTLTRSSFSLAVPMEDSAITNCPETQERERAVFSFHVKSKYW